MEEKVGKVVTLPAGFTLFHITPKNVKRNHEEWEHLSTLPKDQWYATKRDDIMFFGLTEFFTKYYDSEWYIEEEGKTTWRCVHLKYTTMKPLKLLNLGIKDNFFEEAWELGTGVHQISIGKTKEAGADGWIANDDRHAGWYEIVILNPGDFISEEEILDHSGEHQMDCDKYPEENDEEEKKIVEKLLM